MEKLYNLLANLEGKKIAVIGDVMLDIHMWCNVSRISPEAPVPVAKVEKITHVPGGAANVARNITGILGKAILIGLIGKDSSANQLKKVLKDANIDISLLVETDRPTTTKTRIIAANQQVVRVDEEDSSIIDQATQQNVLDKIKTNISNFDGIIISDYNKGLLTDKLIAEIIKIANDQNIIVAIDPKGDDYTKYYGATLVTPNKKEAQQAVKSGFINEDDLITKGLKLKSENNFKYLLITRSEEGMSLFVGQNHKHIPTVAQEVFDVSGAGDTVIAVMTLALVSGLDPEKSANLANICAGIVVGHPGTVAISINELKHNLLDSKDLEKPWERKILNAENVSEIINNLKNEEKIVVSTNGVFDILHVGHSRYLTEAKSLGDVLIVAVNSDESVRKIKGPTRPINKLADRLEMLANLEIVDFVVAFNEETPEQILGKIKPNIHVKGGDYKVEDLPESKIVYQNGGEVKVLSLIDGKSSTNIIKKMKE